MITINKSTRIDKNNVYAECTAETVADLDDFPNFARTHELQHGSTVLCQENSEVYSMLPDYTLKML